MVLWHRDGAPAVMVIVMAGVVRGREERESGAGEREVLPTVLFNDQRMIFV